MSLCSSHEELCADWYQLCSVSTNICFGTNSCFCFLHELSQAVCFVCTGSETHRPGDLTSSLCNLPGEAVLVPQVTLTQSWGAWTWNKEVRRQKRHHREHTCHSPSQMIKIQKCFSFTQLPVSLRASSRHKASHPRSAHGTRAAVKRAEPKSGPQLIGTVRGAPQRLHVAPRQRRAEPSPQIQHFNPPGVHSESKQGVNERLLLWAGPTFLYGSIAALRATEQLALLARPKRRPWPTSAGTLRSSPLSRSSTEHRPLASTGSARITRRGRTEKLF